MIKHRLGARATTNICANLCVRRKRTTNSQSSEQKQTESEKRIKERSWEREQGKWLSPDMTHRIPLLGL